MVWPTDKPFTMHVVPVNNAVVTIPNLDQSVTLSLEHLSTIANLTIAFPAGFESREIKLLVASAVTRLTVNGTVMSPPASLAAGDTRIFTCPVTGSSVWM